MRDQFATLHNISAVRDECSEASGNFHRNDRGGVTYTPSLQIGEEARSELLADVRVLADATRDLCAAHRNFWPERYPVPEDVHCALLAADYGLARVRSGMLRRLAEQDNAPTLTVRQAPLGQMRQQVDLADLQLMADAAAELDDNQQFYVDRPDEQRRLAAMASRLRGIVERAVGDHAEAITIHALDEDQYGRPVVPMPSAGRSR